MFVAFFLVVYAVYLLSAGIIRKLVLLIASYAFYAAAQPAHALLLAWVTGVTFWAATSMSRRGRASLILGLVGVLGTLFTFKYLGFALATLGWGQDVGAAGRVVSTLVLPVGISFYTMQAASYLIDVRRGTVPASGRFLETALYLAYFPQVLAGPIERAKRLMPQLVTLGRPSAEDLYLGAKLLLWGYFAKTVLGDGIGRVIDDAWVEWAELSWLSIVVIHVLFSLQIFFDFEGYTSIARGLGRLMGVSLSRNFASPYAARSIRDFWRRWHITLTSWFRDYVYIPLGGNRGGRPRWMAAVLAVFLLSGLWHGAAASFMIWGGLHAIFYLLGELSAHLRYQLKSASRLDRLPGVVEASVQVAFTFLFVSLAWIPFRINDPSILLSSTAKLMTFVVPEGSGLLAPSILRLDSIVFIVLGALFVVADGSGWIRRFTDEAPTGRAPVFGELATANVMAVLLIFLGDLGSREFLYFRF